MYSAIGSPGSSSSPPALPDVKLQDIAENVRVLRSNFATGATRDVALRKQLLKQLRNLLHDGEPALKEALWKDLHKHPTETYAAELSLLYGEIQDHLDQLGDWANPERVTTNIVNLPGLSYIKREPLGIVCIFGTWNYPANLLLTPLIAAISAGNCVLMRLAGEDTTMHFNNVLIRLLDKHMDSRYIRYVYGGIQETQEILQEKFDLIFATGGTFLGKIVAKAAAETLTPVVLELGGKTPTIIDASADIALAARRIGWGAFINSGQTCVRPDYILIDASVGDYFVKALQGIVHEFYGQDPKQSEFYGRVINSRAYDRLSKLLEADRKYVTFGGESDEKERYFAPTIFNFKTDLQAFKECATMQEEVFGPLLPVYYYEPGNLSFAIDFVTSRDKPLALYVFSTTGKNKQRVVNETSAGSLVVNDTMMQLSNPHVPFGGVGNSGMGAYHGKFGFEAFSHRKAVIYKYSVLDLPQRYAPYTPASERVLRIVQYPFSRAQVRIVLLVLLASVVAVVAAIVGA